MLCFLGPFLCLLLVGSAFIGLPFFTYGSIGFIGAVIFSSFTSTIFSFYELNKNGYILKLNWVQVFINIANIILIFSSGALSFHGPDGGFVAMGFMFVGVPIGLGIAFLHSIIFIGVKLHLREPKSNHH